MMPQDYPASDRVFLLWHTHTFDDGSEDSKLLGVYRSKDNAKAAIDRVAKKPGFVDAPEGFLIDMYALDQDCWTDGYVTLTHGDQQEL